MKRILIVLAGLLVVGNAYALPPCPTSGTFHNCFGAFTFDDGDKYVGEFKDDEFHGQGTYTATNGTKYVGDHKYGKKHGHGTFTTAKGNNYVGEWKDGKKHGQGTLTSPDGAKYDGEWKDGNPWNGTDYDEDGEITATYLDGVMTEK